MKLPLLNSDLNRLYDDVPTEPPNQSSSLGPTTAINQKSTRKKKVLYDILGFFALLIFIAIFYLWLRPPTQYFQVNDPSLMYAKGDPSVPSVLVATLSIILPIAIVLLWNIFFCWNKWDLYSGIAGSLLAWALALFFTSALWVFIGGLRPYFLSICNVDYSRVLSTQTWYSVDICKNKDAINDDVNEFHGFPSGHASTAFAGSVFATCYLASHLRVYRNGNLLKIWVTILPLFLALWMSFSRLIDHHHNALQIIVGVLIGIFSALFAYRIMYFQGFRLGYGKWAHLPFMTFNNI